MLDLARALVQATETAPAVRLHYTSDSIARAHAEMLAEMEAENEKRPRREPFPARQGQ